MSVLLNINDYIFIIIPAELLWLQRLCSSMEKFHKELEIDNNLEEYCFKLELIIKVAKCHADYTQLKTLIWLHKQIGIFLLIANVYYYPQRPPIYLSKVCDMVIFTSAEIVKHISILCMLWCCCHLIVLEYTFNSYELFLFQLDFPPALECISTK